MPQTSQKTRHQMDRTAQDRGINQSTDQADAQKISKLAGTMSVSIRKRPILVQKKTIGGRDGKGNQIQVNNSVVGHADASQFAQYIQHRKIQ